MTDTPFATRIERTQSDQFDAHNRFHGGQLGLTADLTHGPVFVEATGKVALGQAVMVVRASGQTVAASPGFPVPAVLAFPGGVLAQPTNSGRFLQTAFAVLPEAVVKVGYGGSPPSTVCTTLMSRVAVARSPMAISTCARSRNSSALRRIGSGAVVVAALLASVMAS